jgi:methylmalonyl-CoA mutase
MRKRQERLFSEFPEISTREWEDVIEKDLKGADYAKKLIWKTDENFLIKPYYRAEDLNDLHYLNQIPGEFPFVRSTKNATNNWRIVEHITETNSKKSKSYSKNSIAKGANALFCNAKNYNQKAILKHY